MSQSDIKVNGAVISEPKSKTLNRNIFQTTNLISYWISMECQQPINANQCTFSMGSIDDENPYIQFSLPNPWYTPIWSTIVTPSHFSFLPGSKDTTLTILSSCTAGHDQRCSHDSDCQKSNLHLQCQRSTLAKQYSKCVCIDALPKWSEKRNTCVTPMEEE